MEGVMIEYTKNTTGHLNINNMMMRSLIALIFIASTLNLSAQSITPTQDVTVNDIVWYTIVFTETPLGNYWDATGGSVIETTENNSTNTYKARVAWNNVGVQTITFSDVAGPRANEDITVNHPPVQPGSVSGQSTVCLNSTASLIATDASEGDGTYTYTWQWSNSQTSGFVTAPGTNNQLNYTTPAISGNKYFRIHYDDGYTTAVSDAVLVNNYVVMQVGSIDTSNDMVCSGQSPSPITSIGLPTEGDENYIYLWEWSDYESSGYEAAPGDNNDPSYQPPVMTIKKYFRRKESDGCGTQLWSDSKLINVATPYTMGTITGTEMFCYGANIDVDLTYTGDINHPLTLLTWERKAPGQNWEPDTNTFTANYTENNAPAGTQYRVVAGNVCSTQKTVATTVNNYLELQAPTVSGSHEICSNTTIGLSGTAASGGKGTASYTYTWLWSDVAGHSYSAAPGSNNQLSYTTPAISSKKYFKLRVDDGCHVKTSSSYITVDDYEAMQPGSINAFDDLVCTGSAPASIPSTGLPSNGDESFTYLWQWSDYETSGYEAAPGDNLSLIHI